MWSGLWSAIKSRKIEKSSRLVEPTLNRAASPTLARFFSTPTTRSRTWLFPVASSTLNRYQTVRWLYTDSQIRFKVQKE